MTDVLQQEIAPGVKLTLGAVDYELTLPLSAVIRYKQKTGDNLFNPAHWSRIDDDPERLLSLLWVAVQEKQPGTKLDDIEPLVNIGSAPQITTAIIQLLRSYFPKPKEEAEGEVDPNGQVPESK